MFIMLTCLLGKYCKGGISHFTDDHFPEYLGKLVSCYKSNTTQQDQPSDSWA